MFISIGKDKISETRMQEKSLFLLVLEVENTLHTERAYLKSMHVFFVFEKGFVISQNESV